MMPSIQVASQSFTQSGEALEGISLTGNESHAVPVGIGVHVFPEDKRDHDYILLIRVRGGMRLSMLALDCIPLRTRPITNFVHQIPIIVGTGWSSRLT